MAFKTWTLKDAIEAYKQGWGLFEYDQDMVILALDDPAAVAEDHGFSPFNGIYFMGNYRDSMAYKYVKKQAEAGDSVCKKAISLVSKQTVDKYYRPASGLTRKQA